METHLPSLGMSNVNHVLNPPEIATLHPCPMLSKCDDEVCGAETHGFAPAFQASITTLRFYTLTMPVSLHIAQIRLAPSACLQLVHASSSICLA